MLVMIHVVVVTHNSFDFHPHKNPIMILNMKMKKSVSLSPEMLFLFHSTVAVFQGLPAPAVISRYAFSQVIPFNVYSMFTIIHCPLFSFCV